MIYATTISQILHLASQQKRASINSSVKALTLHSCWRWPSRRWFFAKPSGFWSTTK